MTLTAESHQRVHRARGRSRKGKFPLALWSQGSLEENVVCSGPPCTHGGCEEEEKEIQTKGVTGAKPHLGSMTQGTEWCLKWNSRHSNTGYQEVSKCLTISKMEKQNLGAVLNQKLFFSVSCDPVTMPRRGCFAWTSISRLHSYVWQLSNALGPQLVGKEHCRGWGSSPSRTDVGAGVAHRPGQG